jgi:tRNA A-37 threonylcarbamoyl transferase component Bud32
VPSPRAPWWMFLVAASFLGYFALDLYVASPLYHGPGPLGLIFDNRSSWVILERVEPGSTGERSGLRVGDRIVSANGVPIRRRVNWDIAGMTFDLARPLPLVIEREGRRIELSVTLEPRSSLPLSPEFLLLAATDLFALALAFVVAFRRPHDLVARVGAWFLATTAIANFPPLYGFGSVWRQLPVPLGALLWVAEISELVFPAIFFTFFAIFPRPLFHRRWIWALVWAPSLLWMGLLVRVNYALVYQTSGAISLPPINFPAFFALRGCYVLGGLVVLVMNYRRLKDISERRRMRVLVVGSVIGWVAIGLFLAFIVAGGGPVTAALLNTPFMPTMLVLYLVFPVSFAYAILRHRVFDLGVIVRQGLQYALARGVLLTAVPVLGLVLVADLLLHGQQPLLQILRDRGWIYVVLAGLAVVAYLKRQTWLEALDRRFFRERFDAQRLLREVVEEIREASSFTQVAPRVVARVEAALHPEFAALLVREPREANYRTLAIAPAAAVLPVMPAQSKLMAMVRLLGKPLEVPQTGSSWLGEQLPHGETEFLRQARVEFLVPIATAQDRTEAVLVLGIKRSEEPYSREDRDLLMAIAASLALLVEKPSGATAPRTDVFEECPQCGACYDSGATHCTQEGARLIPVILPRLLEGRYALERRLGRGGMGTVYVALDTALERRIAVKVIREDLVGSAEAAERFRQEARVAASFAHRNVVTVHDFGVAAGTRAFLVMELQEGETLREALRREKRFATARALAILGDVTAALEAAHRRQLVHRDLKPENIFLASTESGEIAKVLDFGIAKFLSNATQNRTADTAPGALLGTPRYMSPEQRHGGEAHPAWDVWALSVVTYEVLTGAYPFDEASPAERFGADGASKFIPVTTHLPGAPQSCQELFERSFAREPDARPQSAQTFLSQLQNSLG